MSSAMLGFLLALGIASMPAVNGQCINVTLPNILNLGECLGTTLRACPDTSDGLIPDLTTVVGCVLQILPQVASPVSVLFNVVGLLEAVVAKLGLSGDIGGLANILCNPLGISLFNCGAFSPGNLACQEPLQISLPSVFNIGSCLNRTLLFCDAGSTVTEPILNGLISAVACILTGAPDALQLDLVSSLVCPLVDILNSSLDEFTSLLPFRFLTRGITNVVNRLTSGLLGSVGNC
uniref:23 kDa family member n=1 Tax=Amblyomma cajennense TaxID=34607 RepID=A0A023FUA4_AMBCJ